MDEKQKLQAACELLGAEMGIEQGDTVKVIRKYTDHEMGSGMDWCESYDKQVGSSFVVDGGNGRDFSLRGGGCYPWFCLELVKKVEKPEPITSVNGVKYYTKDVIEQLKECPTAE